MRYLPVTKKGWPVEFIIGRPIVNAIRFLLHTKGFVCKNCFYSQMASKKDDTCSGVSAPSK